MTPSQRQQRRTQISPASHVRVGDEVLSGNDWRVITRVRRAQGRKPAKGENLHLIAGDHVIKINSLEGVRIQARH